MRYFEMTIRTNEDQIQEHATVKLREYCYDSVLGAMNHYIYKNLPGGVYFFGYRVEGDVTRSVFCYDEKTLGYREALDHVTGILQDVFKAGRIQAGPEEITMFQTLDCFMEARRRDYAVNGGTRLVDAMNLWIFYEPEREGVSRHFDFRERLVPEKGKKSFLYDPSLVRELENIEAHQNAACHQGNLVHYVISGRSPEAAADMTEALMQRLLKAGRIRSRRMEIVSQMDPDAYRSHYLEKIIENNEGGVVIFDLKEKFGYDPVQYSLMSQYLEKLLKQYRNKCLFVFTYDMDRPGFAFQLLPQIKKYVLPVQLREGKGDRKEAIRYMRELIKNSEYAAYAGQAAEYMKNYPGREFSQTDVLLAHEQFESWCLNKNMLQAYDFVPSESFLLDRDEMEGSAYDRLQKLVGLDIVKKQIDRILATELVEKERKKQKGKDYPSGTMHMVFAGNPGSAKTTVARLFAGIAKEKGILKSGACVERGGVEMNSVIALRDAFKAAKGGVLLIDEAYAMWLPSAITALIQEMENRRDEVIVILAGYNERMKEFMKQNEGFKSRIPYWVDFPDYSADELVDIFRYELDARSLSATREAVEEARSVFEKARCTEDFGNGRYVRNLVEKALQNQAERFMAEGRQVEELSDKTLFLLEKADITALDEGLKKQRPAGTARKELEEMIGLASAKEVLHKALARLKMTRLCLDKGIGQEKPSFHMVFTGNPGTAKTTVARLLAEILRDERLLPTGNFVEVGRSDLVGMFSGHTAPLVRKKFREAQGGVLFIDEAYALLEGMPGGFGDEAIHTIVQEMENHREDVIVIFAGYPEPMEVFLGRNPGMRSRIAFQVAFEDYNTEELVAITRLMASKMHRQITQEALDKLAAIYEQARLVPGYGNGRFVRNMLEEAEMNLAQRVVGRKAEELSPEILTTIEACDIPVWVSAKPAEKAPIGFAG